jgi:hypothetical protein
MRQKNWVWSLGILVMGCFIYGCATPAAIKQASRSQLELIKTVDSAVQDFSAALGRYYTDKENLIKQEGHMKLARQAIESSLTDTKKAEKVGVLYDIYQDKVERYIDYGLDKDELTARQLDLEKKLEKESGLVEKAVISIQLDNIKQQLAELNNMPEPVKNLASAFNGEIRAVRSTSEENLKMLGLLRSQLALMLTLQEKVDAWLSIDVSITQDQANAMEKTFIDAYNGLSGGQK